MQVFEDKDVKNVLLFSGGLNSILSYIKIKDNAPNLKLIYVPVFTLKAKEFVTGEMATMKLLANHEFSYLDHAVDILGRHNIVWSKTWTTSDPYYLPYRIPELILFALMTYKNIDKVYIGGLADSSFELSKESLKKLQVVLRELGHNKDFSIISPFDWELTKSEAIKAVLKPLKEEPAKLLSTIKFLLHSYDSYGYTKFTIKDTIKSWFTKNISKMKLKYKEVDVALNSLLRSKVEIPGLYRRTYSTIADLEYNAAIYNGLGLVFPFYDNVVLLDAKAKALDNKSEMSSKQRKAILDYINAFEKLNIDNRIKTVQEMNKPKRGRRKG